jgi:predicted nuclease of predicted toxin-antitoxin system
LKFLIDECLHTSLLKVAYDAGYEAYHVNHRGKSGAGDEELMRIALAEELTIVTNNADDFRRLISRTNPHPRTDNYSSKCQIRDSASAVRAFSRADLSREAR